MTPHVKTYTFILSMSPLSLFPFHLKIYSTLTFAFQIHSNSPSIPNIISHSQVFTAGFAVLATLKAYLCFQSITITILTQITNLSRFTLVTSVKPSSLYIILTHRFCIILLFKILIIPTIDSIKRHRFCRIVKAIKVEALEVETWNVEPLHTEIVDEDKRLYALPRSLPNLKLITSGKILGRLLLVVLETYRNIS